MMRLKFFSYHTSCSVVSFALAKPPQILMLSKVHDKGFSQHLTCVPLWRTSCWSLRFSGPDACTGIRRYAQLTVASLNPQNKNLGPSIRPSKTASKKHAQSMQDLGEKLASLTPGQLKMIGQVIPEEIIEALVVVRKIPHRNQGRKRQINLIGQLLHNLDDEEQKRIEGAIDAGRHGESPTTRLTESLVQTWQEGLLSDNKEVVQEVYSLPRDIGIDFQKLRQLVLEAKQEAQVPMAEFISEGTEKDVQSTPKAQKKLLRALRPLAAGVVAGVSVSKTDP